MLWGFSLLPFVALVGSLFPVTFAQIIAQSDVSVVQVLMVVNGAITVSLGAVYRDCRKEREKLWQHIRELERRVNLRA